jgi:hypothetical protein
MNKLIIFLILGVFLETNLSSQSDGRTKFQFGIKAGANYANVYDGVGQDFRADSKFGFVGGVFISIPIVSAFGFQPEILYSQKGFKGEGTLLGSNYKLTRTVDYIDIPLFLAIKPISGLTILAGPQVSYLRRRKDVFENATQNFEQIELFKNENLRKNIYGVSFGINLNLDKLVLGVRTAWDLTENNGDGTSETPRYKNTWLQGTLGYRFL